MISAQASAVALVAGAGVLLLLSPWLWPRSDERSRRRPDTVGERMRARLALAGLGGVPPVVLLLISGLVGLAAAGLLQAIVGVAALSVAAGLVGFCAPALVVTLRARARRVANRALWPDVVDHLLSAVRAGIALPDAVASLAQTGPAGTRSSFAAFEREYRATGNFSHSIDQLKDDLADPVADRLLETLRMAREVGGSDLGEVLRSLAAYLRDDAVVRAELRARQSWIVNAARLGVVAPWIVLLMLSTRPEGAAAYNSPAGAVLILVGLVVSALAYLLMIRVGKLPEEQRWFR